MAREPLAIAVAQPRCVSGDVAANALAHAEMVRAAGARLVVFPELSLTGYELEAPVLAAGDPRLLPLAAACAETGSVALAGAPVEGEDGRSHIGMLAFAGGGARVAYRKMWLGTAEAERFTAGGEPAVIDVDGWRIGLAICKDTGVREHAIATAARGIDVYAAGVLETAAEAPLLEKRARRIAMEHGVWVAVASFAGSTGGGYAPAAGRSAIWSPEGLAIAAAGPEVGELARAVLA